MTGTLGRQLTPAPVGPTGGAAASLRPLPLSASRFVVGLWARHIPRVRIVPHRSHPMPLVAGATGWIAWNNTDHDDLAAQDPYRRHRFLALQRYLVRGLTSGSVK